jgi:hypothetical protein
MTRVADPVETAIKELQTKKELFARPLGAAGRNWFTTRIVTHVKNEPDIKAAATAKLTKATAPAEARPRSKVDG